MYRKIFITNENSIKPILLTLVLFLFCILSLNLFPPSFGRNEINKYERTFARYLVDAMMSNDTDKKDNIIINEYLTKYMGLSPKAIGIIPPFIPITLRDRIRTAPQYNLLACSMHKHMSSMISPAMCYLRNETRYIKDYGPVIADNHNACIDTKKELRHAWFHDIRSALGRNNKNKLKNWTFFSFSRDPIERFISGFSNICVDNTIELGNKTCYDCGIDLECFIDKLYKDMMGYSIGKKIKRYEVAAHFYPQNWMCDYFQYYSKYKIIPYSSKTIKNKKFLSSLIEVLKSAHVPDSSIKFIISQFKTTKTHHRTVGKKTRKDIEEKLKNAPHLMEKLYQMFYYDFILFNYNLPKEYLWKGPDVMPPDIP